MWWLIVCKIELRIKLFCVSVFKKTEEEWQKYFPCFLTFYMVFALYTPSFSPFLSCFVHHFFAHQNDTPAKSILSITICFYWECNFIAEKGSVECGICWGLCSSAVKDGGRSGVCNHRRRHARDFLPAAKNISLSIHTQMHTHQQLCSLVSATLMGIRTLF